MGDVSLELMSYTCTILVDHKEYDLFLYSFNGSDYPSARTTTTPSAGAFQLADPVSHLIESIRHQ